MHQLLNFQEAQPHTRVRALIKKIYTYIILTFFFLKKDINIQVLTFPLQEISESVSSPWRQHVFIFHLCTFQQILIMYFKLCC